MCNPSLYSLIPVPEDVMDTFLVPIPIPAAGCMEDAWWHISSSWSLPFTYGKERVFCYQVWDWKTLQMFQLNASVFIRAKVSSSPRVGDDWHLPTSRYILSNPVPGCGIVDTLPSSQSLPSRVGGDGHIPSSQSLKFHSISGWGVGDHYSSCRWSLRSTNLFIDSSLTSWVGWLYNQVNINYGIVGLA